MWEGAHETRGIGRARLSRDSTRLMTFTGGTLKVWNRSTRSIVREVAVTPAESFGSMGVLGDWSAVFVPDWPTVHVYPLDGTARYDIRHPVRTTKKFEGSVALAPDGVHVVTIGGGVAAVWARGRQVPVARMQTSQPGADMAAAMAGDTIALFAGTTLALHTYRDGRLKSTARVTGRTPHGFPRIALSPSGKVVAIGDEGENWLTIPDPQTGNEIGAVAHPETISAIAWTTDGRRLITADGIADSLVSQLQITEIAGATIDPIATVFMRGLPEVIMSPDSQRIATSDIPGPVRIWDDGGTELARIPGRPRAFSSDGTRIAVLGDKGRLDVWDLSARVRYVTPSPRIMNTSTYRRETADLGHDFDVALLPCGSIACEGQRVVRFSALLHRRSPGKRR